MDFIEQNIRCVAKAKFLSHMNLRLSCRNQTAQEKAWADQAEALNMSNAVFALKLWPLLTKSERDYYYQLARHTCDMMYIEPCT